MRIGIVGGGIAGLAAAHRLAGAGHDVAVLEPRHPGGVLRSEREDGWVHEHAANAFLSGAPDGAVALCRELGVELEEASPEAKQRWIWVDGRLHALPRGPGGLIKTGLLSWRGKLALLAEPFRRRSNGADETVHDFAARRLGEEAAHRIVGPFVTGVFGGDARDISLAAGFPRLAALEEHGGLVRGMIATRRAARKAGVAREPMRSLAPRGGVESLPRELAARLGDRVRQEEVAAVIPARGGIEIVAGGRPERYDGAVVATPAYVTARLCGAAPELETIARAAAAVPYAPAVIAFLGYRRADVPHPLDGFGLLVAAGEAPRVLGIVFESTVWSRRAPEGHVLLRCILGGARDPEAANLDDGAILAAARADVAGILGIVAEPEHTRVVRHPRGIAQYRIGHREAVAAADAVAGRHRLVLAGSGWHGVSVTDCVSDATRIVAEVARW
jgi:oxygen-dependent protoporphyrinogen oxidase